MIVLLSLFTIFTSIISATVGLAGGIVLLSLMTFFMPMATIIPLHGAVQLLSNSSRFIFLRTKIHRPMFVLTSLGIPIGTLIAVLILKKLESELLISLGIVALIFYTVFKPRSLPHLKIPTWSYVILGILLGILGPFIGATGPLLGPFVFREDLSKEEIIATQASIQTVGHFMKIPAFLSLGFNFSEHWILLIAMSASAIIGTRLGVHLLSKIPEKPFRIVFKGAMLFSAARIIYRLI